MMRYWLPLCGAMALVACEPVPTRVGVGFDDYSRYTVADRASQIDRGREAQLRTPLVISPEVTGAPAPSTGGTAPAISADELAAAGIRIAPDIRVQQNGQTIYGPSRAQAPSVQNPVRVSPVTPASATSTRSAAPAGAAAASTAAFAPAADVGAPLVATRSEAQAVGATTAPAQPQAQSLPAGTSGSGDIVRFALSTTHAVGTKIYSRGIVSQNRANRHCARFQAPDIAQRAFLEAGGPQRDKYGIDPDGDGFACGWSPEPFRAALRG